MTERPILMSAPMIRAILAGTKTQTRRVLPTRVTMGRLEYPGRRVHGWSRVNWLDTPEGIAAAVAECRYGKPGDRLWVREAFQRDLDRLHSRKLIVYRADNATKDAGPEGAFDFPDVGWRPSIHMPRWASRITLEVTGVRVERLQDISEADAVAEGCQPLPLQQAEPGAWWTADVSAGAALHARTAAGAYRLLWERINGAGSWDANPWVWAVEFRRIESEAAQERRAA